MEILMPPEFKTLLAVSQLSRDSLCPTQPSILLLALASTVIQGTQDIIYVQSKAFGVFKKRFGVFKKRVFLSTRRRICFFVQVPVLLHHDFSRVRLRPCSVHI
jgi:hypothetical protein